MLLNVLLISGAVHVVLILILGGITVVKYIIPDDAQFEEPPSVAEEAPPPEVQVEIKPQAAPPNQSLNQLQMKQVGNIAVSNVDVDLPSMEGSFTVSAGLGGIGSGSLLGGTRGSLQIGMSNVNIFGMKSRAERFLFMIDASKDILVDEKGGLNSYRVIKDEIANMVANLSAGTLFNVVFYDSGRQLFFKPQPVPAGTQIQNELVNWITPINADAQSIGLQGAQPSPLNTLQDHPVNKALPNEQWSVGNENAYLTQISLEQSVDAIYIITGRHEGFAPVRRDRTAQEEAEWQKQTADPKYQAQLAAYQAARQEALRKARAALEKENQARRARGQPPKIIAREDNNFIREMGVEIEVEHPGYGPNFDYESSEVENYFEELVDVLYEDKGGKSPTINVVLFLAEDEEFENEKKEALDAYVDFFGGDFRILRGLKEVQSAATSSQTQN